MAENVLLTGASGFLGKHFVRALLDEGYHVVATSSQDNALPSGTNIEWLKADLSNPKTNTTFWRSLLKTHKIDHVIHNAGIIMDAPKQGKTFDRVNVEATEELSLAARYEGVRRFLFISTIAAIYPNAEKIGYPGSKRMAERQLEEKTDLDWTIVRPAMTFSECGWGQHLTFDKLAALPITPLLGQGDQLLHPIHVEDVTKTTRLLRTPEYKHHTLNAVGPEAMTTLEMAKFLREKWGGKLRTVQLSPQFAQLFAREYPMGIASPSFVEMNLELIRNPILPIDSTPYRQAVGLSSLTTLREAYERTGSCPPSIFCDVMVGTARNLAQNPTGLCRIAKEILTGRRSSGILEPR